MKTQTIEKNLRKLIADMSNNYDLEQLKKVIDEQIQAHSDDPTNFMFHTKVDDYFYYTIYKDGSMHTGCIGQREYEYYIGNPSAVSIWRREKDYLWNKDREYPMELLLQKG